MRKQRCIRRTAKEFSKGWHGGQPETWCGQGSCLHNTRKQRKWIPHIVQKYSIRTIADVGAGDLNWIAHTRLPDSVEYTPYDIVQWTPEIVLFDLVEQVPPAVDLIMCLWVLNHFSKQDYTSAINNIRKSGAQYLMTTDYRRASKELEIDYRHAEESINITGAGDRLLLIRISQL